MKIVLNKEYGGFSLSKKACVLLNCGTYDYTDDVLEKRADSKLIEVVEKLGDDANNKPFARLVIVEVPDDFTDYGFDSYDGVERFRYVLDGKMYEV